MNKILLFALLMALCGCQRGETDTGEEIRTEALKTSEIASERVTEFHVIEFHAQRSLEVTTRIAPTIEAQTEAHTEVRTDSTTRSTTEVSFGKLQASYEQVTEELSMVPTTEIQTESTTEKPKQADSGDITGSWDGWDLHYSEPYNVTSNHLTRSNGSIRYNGHRETWYSTNEGCGKNTAWTIPGKHVADDGTIRDEDGFICVASSDHKHGTIVMTSVGPGKVYDTGCSHGTIDVYTNW